MLTVNKQYNSQSPTDAQAFLQKSPKVFQEPPHHKKRPRLTIAGRKALRKTFYNPYAQYTGRLSFHTHKINHDGSLRKIRSTKREAITHFVGEALLHFLNIDTMTVGYKIGDRFVLVGITRLAKYAQASYKQTRDALKIYEREGYISIDQEKYKQRDGKCRNRSAKIAVSRKLFHDLGFDDFDIDFYKSEEKAAEMRKIAEQKRLTYNKQARIEVKQNKVDRKTQLTDEYKDQEMPGWRRGRFHEAPAYIEYSAGVPISGQSSTHLADSPQNVINLLKLRLKPPH